MKCRRHDSYESLHIDFLSIRRMQENKMCYKKKKCVKIHRKTNVLEGCRKEKCIKRKEKKIRRVQEEKNVLDSRLTCLSFFDV